MIIATEQMIKDRLAICNQCSEKKLKNGFELCGKCGCVLSGKASIGKPTCPLNRWQ